MSRRNHKGFRRCRSFESSGDQIFVQTNLKPNYMIKRATCQPFNELPSNNKPISGFDYFRSPNKQNFKSRKILKSYMNPGAGENTKTYSSKLHTNIDLVEVLEDLRKQISIPRLKCLSTLLEDPMLGDQVLLYSFEVEGILQECIYSNTNEHLLDQAFYCLTTLGIHTSLFKHDYFDSFLNNLSAAPNNSIYCRYLQALQTILEKLCLSSQIEVEGKFYPEHVWNSLSIFVPLLLRELQYQLEIVDQVDQMQILVSCILVLAKNFTQQFSIYFIDWVDILIGWLVDINHSLTIRSFICDSLKAVKSQWSLEIIFASELLCNFCDDMECYCSELSKDISQSRLTDLHQEQSFIARLFAFSTVYECILLGNPDFEALSSDSNSISISLLRILSFSLDLSSYPEITASFISFFLLILLATKVCLPIFSTKFVSFVILHFLLEMNAICNAISLFNLLSFVIERTTHLSNESSESLIQCILKHFIRFSIQQNKCSVLSKSIITFYQSVFKSDLHVLIKGLISMVFDELEETFSHFIQVSDKKTISSLLPIETSLDETSSPIISDYSHNIRTLNTPTSLNNRILEDFVESKITFEKFQSSSFHFNILSLFATHSNLCLLSTIHKMYQFLSSVLQTLSYSNSLKHPSFLSSAFNALYRISLRFEHFLCPLNNFTITPQTHINLLEPLNTGPIISFPLPYISLCEILSIFQFQIRDFSLDYNLIQLLVRWFLEILEPVSASSTLSNINCNQVLNTTAKLLLTLTYSREQSIRLDISKIFRKLIQENLLNAQTLTYCIPEFILRLCDSVGEIRASFSGLLEILPTHILVSFSIHNMPTFLQSKNVLNAKFSVDIPSAHLCQMIRRCFLLNSDNTAIMNDDFQAVMVFILQGYAPTKQSSEVWLGNLFDSWYAQQSIQSAYFDKSLIAEITGNCDALLWYWVVYECAHYCVSNKLQTFLGNPNSTFLSIESVLRNYIMEVELQKECEEFMSKSLIVHSGSPGTGLGPRHYTVYLRGVLLLQFIEQLEKLIQNEYCCSFSMSAKCIGAKAFFQKNIGTCNEWFSRIRPAVMKMALHSALPTMTIRCGFLLMDGPLDFTNNAFFLLVDALITMKANETLEGISISQGLVGEDWFQGAIIEAQGNYENASIKYNLSLFLESTADNDIQSDSCNVCKFSNDLVSIFCSKRLVQCYFNLGNFDQLEGIFEPTSNNTISIGKSSLLLKNPELNIHFKQIMALSEFQEGNLHPSNYIFSREVSNFTQPHLLWTSKQQLHYSHALLIRGLLPNKYNNICSNVSEDEFEWSPDESDLPPATLGPPHTDRTNISKWRRWLKQASAYAEAPLRVGALEWPIILMPYHVLQLQAIAAVRAVHPDKFRLSQPVGSAFTSIGSSILKLDQHQQDLAIWNQVLLLLRNLAVLNKHSVNNVFISVARLARKQGNIKIAEKLLNSLISNITNISGASCFVDSCKVLQIHLTNIRSFSVMEEKHLPIYYECSKLLFIKNELLTACHIILNSYANYLLIIDNLSQVSREYISRMFISLSKWFEADASLFELVCSLKSEGPGLYSLLFVGNFLSHNLTWQDCITGLLQRVANEKYSSGLGKSWLKFANWNYRVGVRMHNSIYYGQTQFLLSFEEEKILQVLPIHFSHEEKRMVVYSFSKLILQSICKESDYSLIGENNITFNSFPSIIEIDNLCSLFPSLRKFIGTQKLLTIWIEILERIVSPFIYSAQAYFTFLTKSFGNIKESDSILATLRLLRFTETFFTEMKHTLKSGFRSTPICVWKRMIPQLISQLKHKKIGVRHLLSFLLCKMAEIWPHLLLYKAILSSPSSQNENLKNKLQDFSILQNTQCLVSILQRIFKQNQRLVNNTRCLINEFQRISLLWDELWIVSLTSIHSEFCRILSRFYLELTKLSSLSYLSHDKKNLLFTAKYHQTMSPIFKILFLLMETVTLPPQTPFECTFQNNNRAFIIESINDIRNPQDLNHQVKIRDAFRRLIDFFFSMQQKQLLQKVLNLNFLSPILSIMINEEALIPGISTINDKPILLTNVCPEILIQPTKTRPKKIGINASDGKRHYFLLKGLENLHLDERIMQLLGIVNCLLNDSNLHQQGLFQARHYRVTPLGGCSGIIEWVENATPIFTLYKRWQLNSLPRTAMQIDFNTLNINPLKPSEIFYSKLNPLLDSLGISTKSNTGSLRKIWPKDVLKEVFLVLQTETPSNLISCELWFNSTCSSEWWIIQQSFCRSLAVMSVTGYIIGLGDRHLDNILLDFATGEIIHVDYNVCFENGVKLRVPETVPFRLTQNFRQALGPSDIEGIFKISFQKIMTIYIVEKEIILNLLKTFLNDPLVNWANAKLTDQSYILDRFTDLENQSNTFPTESILAIQIMEHWPEWTNLYIHGAEICETILKGINDYQSSLLQQCSNKSSNVLYGKQLSVLSEIENNTFNNYLVSILEFNNHKDNLKMLVSTLSNKTTNLKTDQLTNDGKKNLTKIQVSEMFERLRILSKSEIFTNDNNLPLELLVSNIPNELMIEYTTLQSQMFNLINCSTFVVNNVLCLLMEHCDFANLNFSDIYSYWISLLQLVIREPTEKKIGLAINEVNHCFTDQSTLINTVAGGISQLNLHLQHVESKIHSLEERFGEINNSFSFNINEEIGNRYESIIHCINNNDGANSKTVLNLIGSALPEKFEKWYCMELIAKNSGNNLCELMSEDGDWFLEELCTMSGNVYQMLRCSKLVLFKNNLPKFRSLKNTFKSMKLIDILYCGLRDLHRKFQHDYIPLIVQIQQCNEFQKLIFHLDEIKGTSDLSALVAESEKIYRDHSLIDYHVEKSKIHSIAEKIIHRYKHYLHSVYFDLNTPIFQLIFLIFNNYLNLSQIYEDYHNLNWKKNAISLIFALEDFQRSVLLQTYVHPSDRQLIGDLFFFKYLLMSYNIIYRTMDMMSILTKQTCSLCNFNIYSEYDLLLPLRQYLADFIVERVLGYPTQALLSVIIGILDCLGVIPTFKMAESIESICKRGVEIFFQRQPSLSNVTDISSAIASLDMAWRKKDMCERLKSNISITKCCVTRARDFLNVYCLNSIQFLRECPFKSKFLCWFNRFSKSGLTKLNTTRNLLLNKIRILDSELFLQISLIPNSAILSSIFEKYINTRNVIVIEASKEMDRVGKYFSDTMCYYKFRWMSEDFTVLGKFLLSTLEELQKTVEIISVLEEQFPPLERCLLYLDLTFMRETTKSGLISHITAKKNKLRYIECNMGKKLSKEYNCIEASFDLVLNLRLDFKKLYSSFHENFVKLSTFIKNNQIWSRVLKYCEYAMQIWDYLSSDNLDANDLTRIFEHIDKLRMILLWTVGYLLYYSTKDLGMDISSMLDCDLSIMPNLLNLDILHDKLVMKLRMSLPHCSLNENSHGNVNLQYENTVKIDVWKRIIDKFSVVESNPFNVKSITENVDSIINDAVNVDNLSQMYEGWTSWV